MHKNRLKSEHMVHDIRGTSVLLSRGLWTSLKFKYSNMADDSITRVMQNSITRFHHYNDLMIFDDIVTGGICLDLRNLIKKKRKEKRKRKEKNKERDKKKKTFKL